MQLIAGLFANTGVISEACLPEQASACSGWIEQKLDSYLLLTALLLRKICYHRAQHLAFTHLMPSLHPAASQRAWPYPHKESVCTCQGKPRLGRGCPYQLVEGPTWAMFQCCKQKGTRESSSDLIYWRSGPITYYFVHI